MPIARVDYPFQGGVNICVDDLAERWMTLGITKNGTLLVVSHTFTEDSDSIQIRLISARHSTKREQRQYEEGQ